MPPLETAAAVHPQGETTLKQLPWPVDTPGGRYWAEFDDEAPVTREGQLIFFAQFLQKLKATKEGDSNLLDQSMIVYGSGISDGNVHTHDQLPTVLAGRGSGFLTPGRHIIYQRETPVANLFATMLERLDVRWLEEPLARYDLDGLARLAAATAVPLAGGEGNVGLHEYRWLIDRDCYAIVQPDAVVSEGLGQLRKVAAYAELHGKLMVPHHGGNGVAIAAHLHLSASCPNSPYLELVGDPPAFGTEELQGLIAEPFLPDRDGFVRLPEGPGLGVELGDRWAPLDGP